MFGTQEQTVDQPEGRWMGSCEGMWASNPRQASSGTYLHINRDTTEQFFEKGECDRQGP